MVEKPRDKARSTTASHKRKKKHPFLRAAIIHADEHIDQPLTHIKAEHECDYFARDLFPEDDKKRCLLFSNDFKKLSIESLKFRRRLFIGLPEQAKDIVKRPCVRTLDDFHAERNLLSTASQLHFQLTPPRSLHGREIVLFAV